eukprot:22251_1
MSINSVLFMVIFAYVSNCEILKSSEFPQCINKTHDTSHKPYNEGTQYWQDIMNNIYSTGACGAWRSVATTLTTKTILTMSGFASNGISSGSIAAAIQSYYGNVAAGSIFSTLQSLGAIGGVSVFGSMTIGTLIAWSVICSDITDINFMNENATQCFQNEKILYMSLEQAEEIINWAKEYEVKKTVKNKARDILYDTSKKTHDIFEWISVNTMELNEKYEIKETIQDTTINAMQYTTERIHRFAYDINGYFGIF